MRWTDEAETAPASPGSRTAGQLNLQLARQKVRLAIALLLSVSTPLALLAETVKANPGTPIYLTLDQEVTSQKKSHSEGDIVRVSVWSDLRIDGHVLVAAGTPVFARISSLKKAKFAGIKGKLEIETMSTTDTQGNSVALVGGYDKSGKGRMGMSIALAAIVAWPLVFIKGKQAVLPQGTIFDAHISSVVEVPIEETRRVLVAPKDAEAEILYDDIDFEAKPVLIPFAVTSTLPFAVVEIIAINDQSLEDRIKLEFTEFDEEAGTAVGVTEWKPLTKLMAKGMNEITLRIGGELVTVLMEVEL